MKNLTLNLEEEIAILRKYRITSDELMLMRTLLLLQDEENEDVFKEYIEALHDSGVELYDVFLSLQEKGIILKSYHLKKGAFDPYTIPINKAFTKTLYRSAFEMGKELFEEYPQFGTINNSIVPLRTVAKHFDSLEDCYYRYGKIIKWDPEKHNHILELVKWAKEQGNILSCSLSSFVINNGWLDLEAIYNGESGNINYNAIKML